MNHFAPFSMTANPTDGLLHAQRSLSVSPAMKSRSAGPIRRGSITTSRNGNNSRLLGPFFCRWRGCMLMDHPFPTGDAIWKHMETEHFSSRSQSAGVTEACSGGLTCGWIGCDEVRPSLFRLKSHMKKHLDWRPFGCDLCDERFKHRGDQKKHLVRKHPDASQHAIISRPRTPRIAEEDEPQLKSEAHEFDHATSLSAMSPAYPVQPSFPAAIPPPPALSDYAFSSTMGSPTASMPSGGVPLGPYPSYSSCSSTQSAPDLTVTRDPLTTMMVSPGQFAFAHDFGSGTYGLMGNPNGLGFHYPTLDHSGAASPSGSSPDTMTDMLVNPQGNSQSTLASFSSRDADDEHDDRERNTSFGADFTNMMHAPIVRGSAAAWSPALLDVRPSVSDQEDSDVASIASFGRTTPVGFDGIMLAQPSSTPSMLHEPNIFFGAADKLPAHATTAANAPGLFSDGAYSFLNGVTSSTINTSVL
ncbi:hypothetical protein THASP1DRAFT_25719 [Thamnocephalis sphaerospora]|uniref:C2H2-type domain-containing protein n=1 Tax=Thamnocephalis sphaerospora TaxID=78915 RepID=A0A4P9XJG4_9FUNG|nr:hypothetical protein THASP1DRAFT_25719 [Thamnocephalis sphaerospora]|eukprot:RKP05856.1 hypothetical protein THASP1DRAFT_25719 [Thamnocephalis sphaerospora]